VPVILPVPTERLDRLISSLNARRFVIGPGMVAQNINIAQNGPQRKIGPNDY